MPLCEIMIFCCELEISLNFLKDSGARIHVRPVSTNVLDVGAYISIIFYKTVFQIS